MDAYLLGKSPPGVQLQPSEVPELFLIYAGPGRGSE